MSTRQKFICLTILLLLLVPAGCKKSDPQGQGSEEAIKLAGIVFQEDQFFQLVRYGMRKAAEENDIKLFEANSDGKADKESQLVNTYIARGVDAILISPVSETASMTALKRANQNGITIVTYNTNIAGEVPTAYIESDQYDLGHKTGQATCQYIENELGGEAKIAVIAFKSYLPEQSNARTQGFKDQVTQMPGVEIVAEQDAWLVEQAVKKAGYILTSNPDVDIIWSANEGGTVGAVMAVRNSARAGETVVFGTDISQQLIDALLANDGILQAITGQRPYKIGYQAVQSTLKALNGEQFESIVSMPGVLLARDKPEEIRAYKTRLDDLIAKGGR